LQRGVAEDDPVVGEDMKGGLHRIFIGECPTSAGDGGNDDDRIVDQDAEREEEREERNEVDGKPGKFHDEKGSEKGDRNGECGDDGLTEPEEGEKDQEYE
jgi:hypothetical protein